MKHLEADELAELPVFPLPRVVFFPGTLLPLHFFEERYRSMVRDCIEGGPMAMAVALLEPGWEADYEGRPSVHRIAGAGRIVAHEARSNGTYDMLLGGLCRVQLEELPAGGVDYRRARATLLPDLAAARATSDAAALRACATQVAIEVRRREHPDFDLGFESDDGPGRVADLIADRLVADPSTRQAILEAQDVGRRVALVMDAVVTLLAQLTNHGPQS